MELINIKNENGKQLVSAREVHEYLEVGTRFNDWVSRCIEKYDFEENSDYSKLSIVENHSTGASKKIDYIVTLDMAKELAMISDTPKGKEARKYFIECEKKLKETRLPQTYKEALIELVNAIELKEQAESQVKMLTHQNKLYTSSEIAKELNLKSASELNKILEVKKVQYKVNGTWVLTSKYSDKGYNSIKQTVLDSGRIVFDRKWTGTGREFILKLIGVEN